MTIKQLGGVFGRNPTFNDVTIEGQLTFDGDIDINSDLKVSGDIETTGNVIIATSGKGIDFSATAGTGTSELFDDYEEGQWQPVYTSTTDAADNVNNSRVGYYTKVGNIVYATASLFGNDLSGITSTDQVRIGGLPFASSSTSVSNDQAVTVGQYRYLLTTDQTLLIPNAATYIGFTTDGFSGATYATLFQYPSSTGTSLKISMVYQAQ